MGFARPTDKPAAPVVDVPPEPEPAPKDEPKEEDAPKPVAEIALAPKPDILVEPPTPPADEELAANEPPQPPSRDEMIWRGGTELRKYFSDHISAALVFNYDKFDSQNPLFASERYVSGLVLDYTY